MKPKLTYQGSKFLKYDFEIVEREKDTWLGEQKKYMNDIKYN